MFKYALFVLLIAAPLFSFAQNIIISKLNDSSFVYTTFNTYQGERIPANGLLKITQNSVVMIDTPLNSNLY
jgi:metallo-beta-lactamase class B